MTQDTFSLNGGSDLTFIRQLQEPRHGYVLSWATMPSYGQLLYLQIIFSTPPSEICHHLHKFDYEEEE